MSKSADFKGICTKKGRGCTGMTEKEIDLQDLLLEFS